MKIVLTIFLVLFSGVSCLFPGLKWDVYTKENPSNPDTYTDLKQINYSKPTKILIHGFLANSKDSGILLIKDAYMKKKDVTVVILDWFIYTPIYPVAVTNTMTIGAFIGKELLTAMEQQMLSNLTHVHILGHSLGSHMAGFIGKAIKTLSDDRVVLGRITGLDPALPGFSPLLPLLRLAKSDAVFVDIIHTDCYKAGMCEPIGDVDFYPNGGGAPQPGCTDGVKIVSTVVDIYNQVFCSHAMCRIYYAQSILSENITATKCNSFLEFKLGSCKSNKKVIFGENASPDLTGKYYLKIEGENAIGDFKLF